MTNPALMALAVLEATALVALLATASAASAAVVLRRRKGPLQGRLYHVAAPEGRGSPEQFFIALHGLLRPLHRRILEGQPWVALELDGVRGQARFLIWIPHGQERFIEHLLRAAYPDVELRPVADDTLAGTRPGQTAVAAVSLAKDSALPVATEVDGDSLASLLSTLARARGDEHIHVSLLVQPIPNGWQGRARAIAHRLRTGRRSDVLEILFPSKERVRPTAHELERAKRIEEKAGKLGFRCALRVYASAHDRRAAREALRAVAAALRTFHGVNSFRLRPVLFRSRFLEALAARSFPTFRTFILSTEELAALWHLPEPVPHHVEAIRSPKLPPPAGVSGAGRVLGVTNYPGQEQPVALSVEDSRRHLHVLGPTGTGKTTLLLNLALQDIEAGRGVGIIDPKGDLVEGVLERFPRKRIGDVVLITPEEADVSLGLNPLEWQREDERELIAEEVLSIFKRIYERHWGMRTDDILKAALHTLLRRPDATLCEIPILLSDRDFRSRAIQELDDPIGLASFWRWFEALSDAQRTEAIGPVLNKLRDFLVRPRIRRLLCQKRSTIDLQAILDRGGILLANLSTGRWGDQTAALLGSFLVAKTWQAVRRRAFVPEAERRDFFLYVDEFQQFLGIAGPFADTLAQARSFHLSLTLANQHLGQLPRDLVEAITSNARSRVAFQCGQDDARYLAREFQPLDAQALQALPRFEMAVRLSVGGETSRPFTARTVAPPPPTDPSIAEQVASASRARFGRLAKVIDEELVERLGYAKPKHEPAPRRGVGVVKRTP